MKFLSLTSKTRTEEAAGQNTVKIFAYSIQGLDIHIAPVHKPKSTTGIASIRRVQEDQSLPILLPYGKEATSRASAE
jgi:hypothetical protein